MDVQRIELEADRIVAEELDRARQKIIENHVAAGQRTTGTTADSITIAVTTNGGVTTGTMDAAHILQHSKPARNRGSRNIFADAATGRSIRPPRNGLSTSSRTGPQQRV